MAAQYFLLVIAKNISPSGSSGSENHLPKYSGSNPLQYSLLFIENSQLTVTNILEKYSCKRKAGAHHAVFTTLLVYPKVVLKILQDEIPNSLL